MTGNYLKRGKAELIWKVLVRKGWEMFPAVWGVDTEPRWLMTFVASNIYISGEQWYDTGHFLWQTFSPTQILLSVGITA